jgi:predicted molibdopterin-dependent oxidoreductase YjgC
MEMEVKINGKKYQTQEGETVLDVCRREGIRIPTLCNFEGLPKEAVCRLCLVEINLTDKLVPSCAFPVCEKLEVTTESERINKARGINLELLWADHAGKCATCKKNRMCELQALAQEYEIENFHFVPRKDEMTSGEELQLLKENWSRVVVEKENPCINRNSEFCVECKRCINICPEKKFGMNHRAGDIVVGTPYNQVLDCSFCGKCVESCPTAALTDQNDYEKIISFLDDMQKMVVAVLDFGMEEKILSLIKNISPKKDIKKMLFSLGFERIAIISEEDAKNEDEVLERIKSDYVKKEKIGAENIVMIFVSSKIYKKKKKLDFLDYVLSEREMARLVRDKVKTTD